MSNELLIGSVVAITALVLSPNLYRWLSRKWHDKLSAEYVRGVNDGVKLERKLAATIELRAIPPEALQVEMLERWMEL